VRGVELYNYVQISLFDWTFDAYPTAAEYVLNIKQIIEYLHEEEEEIKSCLKTFYLLNSVPASWRELRDL